MKFDLEFVTDDDGPVPQAQEPLQDPVASQTARSTPRLVTTSPDRPLIPRSIPIRLCDVEEETFKRYPTNIEPLDRVLGGGLVEGSIVLLAGPPGIGKSSLGMQLLSGISRQCLYVSAEESVAQAADRARRINADSANVLIVAESDVDTVFEHARNTNADILFIDSIQTMSCSDIRGGAGSILQVKECTHRFVGFAKDPERPRSVILVGHITHDGSIAGPKTLMHLVDVVLEFEAGDGDIRVAHCPTKNRYGATRRKGLFVMTNNGLVVATDPAGAEDSGNDENNGDGGTGGGLPPGGFH